jgi:Fe-Mn family superoxide dismutase
VEAIQRRISTFDVAVRNDAGRHSNPSRLWKMTAPMGEGGARSVELTTAIDTAFGSLEALKRVLSEAGAKRYGSRWGWLILQEDGTLALSATPNQDNPLIDVVAVRGAPSTCGSTPATSSTGTGAPITSRSGGASSAGMG